MSEFERRVKIQNENNAKFMGNKPPKQDASLLRLQHRASYDSLKRFPPPFQTSYKPMTYSSTSSLRTLKRIAINDLRVNILAIGQYLLLRILEPLAVTVGAATIVEDHLGFVFSLVLYNYFDHDSEIPPEELLPVGTVCVLKEPFLKPGLSEHFFIRCDSPTDLVIIDRNHCFYEEISTLRWINDILSGTSNQGTPSTAVGWKDKGNKLYYNKKYLESIEAYLVSLKMCSDPKMKAVLHANLSAVYLASGCFELALEHASKALDIKRENIKALFRAGRAHYELRQYEKSRNYYEELLSFDPKNEEGGLEFERCNGRMLEEQGVIDVHKLHLTSIINPSTKIDCADYLGDLEVVEISGKGRGVVATADIQPGTFLVVSKALQSSFDTGKDSSPTNRFQYNSNGIYEQEFHMRLLGQTARAIMRNPNSIGNAIYHLSTNEQKMDKEMKLFCNDEDKSEPIADIERIGKILSTNCFTLHSFVSDPKKQNIGSGLFIFPSFFNHSCLYNSTWNTYNDVIVIRSTKYILKGEEVTIAYTNMENEFLFKFEKLSKRGFTCQCNLCVLDISEPKQLHEERATLEAEFRKQDRQGFEEIRLRELVEKIEQTYTNRSGLKIRLCIPYMKLAGSLDLNGKCSKETFFDLVNKALNCLKLSTQDLLEFGENPTTTLPNSSLILEDFIVPIVQIVVSHHSFRGEEDEARRWVKVLLAVEKLVTGGNLSMVVNKYQHKALPAIVSLLKSTTEEITL